MGYTTSFDGVVKFSRKLNLSEFLALKELAEYEQDVYKKYAKEVPSAYNQWEPTEDGMGLEWNGGEKFYSYVEWLEWLIKYFFKPRDIVLNGTYVYQGEETGDVGKIVVKDNKVQLIKYDPEGMVKCPNCDHVFKPEGE